MRCGITFAARQLLGHCGRTGLPGERKEGKRRDVIRRHGRAKRAIGIPRSKNVFLLSKMFPFRYFSLVPNPKSKRKIQKKESFTDLEFHPRITHIPIPAFITITTTS